MWYVPEDMRHLIKKITKATLNVLKPVFCINGEKKVDLHGDQGRSQNDAIVCYHDEKENGSRLMGFL